MEYYCDSCKTYFNADVLVDKKVEEMKFCILCGGKFAVDTEEERKEVKRCILCHKDLLNGEHKTCLGFGEVCNQCYDLVNCFCCGRPMKENEVLKLADLRPICRECCKEAVFEPSKEIILPIFAFLRNFQINFIGQIKFEMRNAQEVKKISNTYSKHNISETDRGFVAGMCATFLSEESPHLSFQERIRGQTIFLLFGLPRPVFEWVLVHELFHVWVKENCNEEKIDRDKGEEEKIGTFIACKFLCQKYGEGSFWPRQMISILKFKDNLYYNFESQEWKDMSISSILSRFKSKA